MTNSLNDYCLKITTATIILHTAMYIIQTMQVTSYKTEPMAIKNSASLRQPEYAATWIYRIMLNEIFHHLKRPDTISYEDSLIAEGKPDQYQDLDLRTALDSLSPEDKAIVELRYFEDLKIEDIARVLNENVNTIKSRLYRSMQKLKLKMEVTE